MHKFDVKYTFNNYYEYYKYVLIKQHLLRDIILSVIFVAFGVFWLIDGSERTNGPVVPILSFVITVMMLTRGVSMLPIVKKQLNKSQADIDRTHIEITFSDDEVVYTNLTVKPEAPVDVKKDEAVDNASEETAETSVEEKAEKEEEAPAANENEFKLRYDNFMVARETKGLFLFYLDRQTVIIIPKETYLNGDNFDEFRSFILSKVNPSRVKFFKGKK